MIRRPTSITKTEAKIMSPAARSLISMLSTKECNLVNLLFVTKFMYCCPGPLSRDLLKTTFRVLHETLRTIRTKEFQTVDFPAIESKTSFTLRKTKRSHGKKNRRAANRTRDVPLAVWGNRSWVHCCWRQSIRRPAWVVSWRQSQGIYIFELKKTKRYSFNLVLRNKRKCM